MHEPADVGGELLRLRTGQHHAVVERVQEARFGDPAFLLDQLAMHDRDLPGRAAEADPAELPPVGERLAARRRLRRAGCQMSPSRSCTSTSSPAATLPVSLDSTTKQFASDIDDRIPEPWSPVVRTVHPPAPSDARMPRWNSVRPGTFLIGAASGTLNVGGGRMSRCPCRISSASRTNS